MTNAISIGERVPGAAAKLSLAPLKANNGSDFASGQLTASNIAVMPFSNQASVFPLSPTVIYPPANGRYPGQQAISYGFGGGGQGIHQLFSWNSNGGVSNWDSGEQIIGPFAIYVTNNSHQDTIGGGNILLIDNSTNGTTLSLRELNSTGYPGVSLEDNLGNVPMTIGYGNLSVPGPIGGNATNYQGIMFFANNTFQPEMFTDNNGFPKWGMPGSSTPNSRAGTFGNFVVFTNTARNSDPSNYVAQIDNVGNASFSGNLTVTNAINVLGSSTISSDFNSTNFTIGSANGANNIANISGGKVTANDNGGVGSSLPGLEVGNGLAISAAESFGCDGQLGIRGQTNIWIHGVNCSGFDPWNGNPGVEIMQAMTVDGGLTNNSAVGFTGNGSGLTNIPDSAILGLKVFYTNIASGATSRAVTFVTPLPTAIGTNYGVMATWLDQTPTSGDVLYVTAKTTNGFTINDTSAITVTGGEGLSWFILPNNNQ